MLFCWYDFVFETYLCLDFELLNIISFLFLRHPLNMTLYRFYPIVFMYVLCTD